MKNYTLITLIGNQDLRNLKIITEDNVSNRIERLNEKKGYGPILDILLKVYNSNEDYNINKLILIKEEKRFKEKFKGEFEYEKGYNGLKLICKSLGIEFQEELFGEDKKIIDYDDIYDTLNGTLKKTNGDNVLINITSGVGHWKVATVMFLDSEKNIFMIDAMKEEEEIEISSEKKFAKILIQIKERILKHSFEYPDFDSELVFKGIENEKNKVDFFIRIAKHYLNNKNNTIFDYPLLITGDTGTGKSELVNYIKSALNIDKKFVEFNSAGLTETLIESELFGHKKDSFTGANKDKDGIIKKANNGVLFMDEIGELSLSAQSKLLRVLQDGSYRVVGGNEEEKSNFVLIAATNRDLIEDIKKGKFREDLYWRINRIIIELPAITKRNNHKEVIREFFEKQLKKQNDFFKDIDDYKINPLISNEILSKITNMDLKGNFRELEKIIRDAIFNNILNGESKEITLSINDFNFKKEFYPEKDIDIDINFKEEFYSEKDIDFKSLIDMIADKLVDFYADHEEKGKIPIFNETKKKEPNTLINHKRIGYSINHKVIEKLMNKFNLNQKEIAQKLCISDKTVTKYKQKSEEYIKNIEI